MGFNPSQNKAYAIPLKKSVDAKARQSWQTDGEIGFSGFMKCCQLVRVHNGLGDFCKLLRHERFFPYGDNLFADA